MNQRRILISFDPRTKWAFRTPVPVEVFDERLVRVAENVIEISDDAQAVVVPGSGPYLVRAELPSGEIVSGMAELKETEAPLVLEAEERSPRENLSWAYARQSVRRASGISGDLRVNEQGVLSVQLASRLPWLIRPEFLGFYRPLGPGGPWPLSLVSEEPNDNFRVVDIDTSVTDIDNRLVCTLRMERFVGRGADSWYPLYVRFRAGSSEGALDKLLAVPPSHQTTILLVRVNNDEEAETWIRPLISSGHPRAEALLSYMQNGSVAAARRVAPRILERASSIVAAENPISAVIAGYFMLQMGQIDQCSWLQRLVRYYPSLPDASIIYGVSLLKGKITASDGETPGGYFLNAVANGGPVYTIGLRLLFNSLERLTREGRGGEEDQQVRLALAQLRMVAAYADWESTTTSFSIAPPRDRAVDLH